MDGHTFNQRLVGVVANGVIDFQLDWPTVSVFHCTSCKDDFLMKRPAGLPGA